MKTTRTFILFVFLFSQWCVGIHAQESQNSLIGMWNYSSDDVSLSSNGKMFLPDGHMYGYSFNPDRTNIGTWIMADYQIVNDSTYIEKCFFHASITWQIDVKMTFHVSEDKQTLTTKFTYIYPNGKHVTTTEMWKRVSVAESQKYMDEVQQNWDALHAQALKDYRRVPDEGETIAKRGEKLMGDIHNALKINNVDIAYELLLLRAELDPSNLQWQHDVVKFLQVVGSAPTNARKYAERYMNLTKAQAVSVCDTTVQQSVIAFFELTNDSVEKVSVLEKQLHEEEISGEPPTKYTAILYLLSAMIRLENKQYDNALTQAMKGAKIFDSVEDEKETYLPLFCNIVVVSTLQGKKDYETAIPLLEKSVTLKSELVDHHLALLALCYDKSIQQGNKNERKRLEALLKDKLWALDIEEGQDSILKRKGMEAGTYYLLQRGNWQFGDKRMPLEYDDLLIDEGDGIHGDLVLMNEKGNVFQSEGDVGCINVRLLLKEYNPAVGAMMKKAWKMYEKDKRK